MEKSTTTQRERPVLDSSFRHIAFIMDGNGRWAKRQGKPREFGHKAGAETFRRICLYCSEIGFEAVTVYAFSTENWKRPKHEVAAIMALLDTFLDELKRDYKKYNNRIRFIGDLTVLTPSLQEKIAYVETLNSHCRTVVNVALNYGGRAEIAHACNELIREGKKPGEVTEDDISRTIWTAGCPDPDMIVRTGGDLRISNFLLWQAAYAELYFIDTLWPDLTPDDVDDCIREFYSRKRRYGGL